MPIPIFEQDKERRRQEAKKRRVIIALAVFAVCLFAGIYFVFRQQVGAVKTILSPVEQPQEELPMTPVKWQQAHPALAARAWTPFCFHDKLVYCDENSKVQVKTDIHISSVLEADKFSDGLARIRVRDGKGIGAQSFLYLNEKGEIAIPANPSHLSYSGPFSEGLACAVERKGGRLGFIDKKGKFAIAPIFQVSIFSTGNQVQRQDQLDNCIFSSGLAPVYNEELNTTGLRACCGYIDHQGKFKIDPRFVEGYPFVSERARICVKDQSKWGRRWGFIDTKGKAIVKPVLMRVEDFTEDLAAVLDYRGKWGFIDKSGQYSIPATFADALPFSEGYAACAISENGLKKWGYIKHDGSFFVQPQFDQANSFQNGEAKACKGSAETSSKGLEEFYSISKEGKVEKIQSKMPTLAIPEIKLPFPQAKKEEGGKENAAGEKDIEPESSLKNENAAGPAESSPLEPGKK